MAFEHPSGLPDAYDRSGSDPARARIVVPEGAFGEAAILNELQALEARRNRRVGNMVAKDGDRLSGADILVDTTSGTAFMSAGSIYVKGDVRPVAAAVLTSVPLTGNAYIGVRLQTTLITSDDDETLLGLEPGSDALGEPTGARENEVLVWAKDGDTQLGDFYPVYLLQNGTVVDQAPPPALTGILAQIGIYDRDANGNYIVDGCEVTALGKTGTDQVFSIARGTANIQGWKRVRETAFRVTHTEDPDLETVTAEPSTYTAATGTPNTVTVLRPPISSITSVVIVKQIVETVTRGGVPGGSDALAHSSVTSIVSVVQGGTTYVAGTDYVLSGGAVSWAPAGAEPAGSSTYQVTYQYNDVVTPTSVTDTSFVVTGGVNGTTILTTYQSKLPRVDILCLDIFGQPQYVKGLAARQGAIAPQTPASLLKLAEISNSWSGTPGIANNGTHNVTYDKMARLFGLLLNLADQLDRTVQANRALQIDPVSKKGIFTDVFADDSYRDQGASQTAASYGGALTLAVDQTFLQVCGTAPVTLDFTEEIILEQPLATSSRLINPYANFTAMPAALALSPPVDYWQTHSTVWTSPVTEEFTAAPNVPPGSTTIDTTIAETLQVATTMRSISLSFEIDGFGAGENLSSLKFDGLDVTPAGPLTANGSGVVTGSFTIPAGVPTGTVLVRADGAAGSFAECQFVSSGTVDVTTMQKVTLVTRSAPAPTVITNTVTVIQQVSTPVVQNTQAFQDRTHGSDPLAETFTLIEPRLVAGVNLKFTAKGSSANGVRVRIVTTWNGYPTTDVVAEAFINMNTVTVGAVVHARFAVPVFLHADRSYAVVVLTADNTHALAIARLGDVDVATQRRVSAQPYTLGVMFSSSEGSVWTPEQDADLWFQIVGAVFSPTSKTVNLWTGALSSISDLMARGTFDVPTPDAALRYEVVRADGSIIKLIPGQEYQASAFITETVTFRAVLTGTAKISPTLFPGSTLIGGQIRTTGTYVTKAFTMGTGVEVAALFAALTPAGSSVTIECDKVDNTWNAMSLTTTTVLGNNWNEPRYHKTGFTTASGRVRITLNGGPGARPSVAQLRAYSF